jgi:dihydropteroate synthase
LLLCKAIKIRQIFVSSGIDILVLKSTLNISGKIYHLKEPMIMGILNATPDSFYSKSRLNSESERLAQIDKMVSEGADMLDVGGYSTRPGAIEVDEKEEIERILPVIKAISSKYPKIIISVDTFRANVAKRAVEAGAHIINDVSGGSLDDKMFKTVSELQVSYILMHMRGNPQTMSEKTNYVNVTKEVINDLAVKVSSLKKLGVKDVIVDPGFGFAKTAEQSFEMLNNLNHFQMLECPILVGLSRKSMIWKTLNITPEEALIGTVTLNSLALLKGANILRVHDVKPAIELRKLLNKNGLST